MPSVSLIFFKIILRARAGNSEHHNITCTHAMYIHMLVRLTFQFDTTWQAAQSITKPMYQNPFLHVYTCIHSIIVYIPKADV